MAQVWKDDQPDTILASPGCLTAGGGEASVLRVGQEQAQEEYQNAQNEVRVQENLCRTEPATPPRGTRCWSALGLILAVLIPGFHVKHSPFSNPPRLILCIFHPPRLIARTSREPGGAPEHLILSGPEHLRITGANGSSKTTPPRGNCPPGDPEYRSPYSRLPRRVLHRGAYIPQRITLDPELTLLQSVSGLTLA